jgi:8-oxo-dGTP pyrophosphatase MutT (NUDIX family)
MSTDVGTRLSSELAAHARAHPSNAPTVLRMLELLGSSGQPYSRQQTEPGHFTASAFVLCPERRRVLLVNHRKLGRWLQPGGHIEVSDLDLEGAARREVTEETGVRLGPRLGPGIFDVDIHPIPERPKEGAHLHFDVRYAFLAEASELTVSGEVLGARWVELSEVGSLTHEESVLRCVTRLTATSPIL